MKTKVGDVAALFRYPVKSMRGERLDDVGAGWHGLDGDRRLALRRTDDRSGFPWLTASTLPELILFAPQRQQTADAGDLPTHVPTPGGDDLSVFGPDLATEIGRRSGSSLEMVHLNRGIFDEASVSLITAATIDALSRLVALPADVRRASERDRLVLKFTDLDAAAVLHGARVVRVADHTEDVEPDLVREMPEVRDKTLPLRRDVGIRSGVTLAQTEDEQCLGRHHARFVTATAPRIRIAQTA